MAVVEGSAGHKQYTEFRGREVFSLDTAIVWWVILPRGWLETGIRLQAHVLLVLEESSAHEVNSGHGCVKEGERSAPGPLLINAKWIAVFMHSRDFILVLRKDVWTLTLEPYS